MAVWDDDDLYLPWALSASAATLRIALDGFAGHRLSWFDAHLVAFAESFSIPLLYSEDLSHNGLYGSVRVINPFVDL